MNCYASDVANPVPIAALTATHLPSWLAQQSQACVRWVNVCGFKASSGEHCLIADAHGNLQQVLLGMDHADDFWAFGALPQKLPQGVYTIDNRNDYLATRQLKMAQLAWGLGSYQFNHYKKMTAYNNQLLVDDSASLKALLEQLTSITLVRDLINTPADDLGPDDLADAIKSLAKPFKATVTLIRGRELETEYPAIHAVGRAACQQPQLVDLRWGDKNAPKLTLVGKGITFDSGGLDLKPSSGMRLMKKDMGGAAHAIGLARMIMAANLPLRLRLLIPAAENAIDADSYRPGDIISTRAGKTVEIENTDAEGRLVLCDALTAAVEDRPDYLIDFATLTGAATVALGPDLPAMYCNDETLAADLLQCAVTARDPVWRMPLYAPYQSFFESPIADMLNASTIPMAGSITAALFLQHFVPDTIRWVHFDLFGYNKTAKAGRPIGGEAMAIRGLFEFFSSRYAA